MLNYSMDIFCEYMVRKKKDIKDFGMILGSILGGFVIIYLAMLFLPIFFGVSAFSFIFFTICGVFYGIYYVGCLTNVEYEYAFTNGDITVDKIINQKSRKRLTSFDCKTVEEIGDYKENESKLANKQIDKKIMACINSDGTDAVYIIAKSRKTGMTMLVFDPNEKMYESVVKYIPRHIKIECLGK